MKAGLAIALAVALGLGHVSPAQAAPVRAAAQAAAPKAVAIAGARIKAKDLFPSAGEVDLGPTPPVGASRVIERAEIERAFAAANVPTPNRLPSSVRVVRKTRRLSADEVSAAIMKTLAATKLPKDAAVAAVRATAIEVPSELARVAVDLPALPRRAGSVTLGAVVTFVGDDDAVLAKTITPIELHLPPEAAFADIARGSTVALVVRRGLVEVTVSGVAATDADVGAIFPVTLRPSGRVVRARALDRDHALAVEQ